MFGSVGDDIKNRSKTAFDMAKAWNEGKHIPKYGSGARSLIKVAGKALGVALDFRWSVSAQATEIRTIDTNLPWDLVPGQITITASLNQIHDPTQSLEQYGLFSTMQAMVHQPYVEIQVLDASLINIFFARGMFTAVNGNISRGQLTSISASFQGVMYQHNVVQEFEPYSKAGDALEMVGSGMKLLKSISGGFF
ncbi:hypothetical protein UFOVP244_183 [uncultured Caudovirales phage]|uniref:Tail tube protein n=1 Tax=uncultured Caudovirales phage TaxID=2100421 RepID=A0A6J7WXQ5_9CAUD|nr:hypothetical protein UFOVP244_183 [uncultured Caudovirales phage]